MEQDQLPIHLAQHESATRSGVETSAVPQPAWKNERTRQSNCLQDRPKGLCQGFLTELLHCIYKMADRWILAGSVPFLRMTVSVR